MRLVLIVGGTRSGKSARAEALAAATGLPVTYVATGAAIDAEMDARIATHRARRPAGWSTVEPRPGDDPLAVARTVAEGGRCALVDGLGGWIATAQHEDPAGARAAVLDAARALAAAVRRDRCGRDDRGQEGSSSGATPTAAAGPSRRGTVIVVAEQAGGGVTPLDAVSRAWVDLLGETTRTLAAAADHAELVVAGRVVPLPAVVDDAGLPPDLLPPPTRPPADLRVHGDTMVRPGDADHAVNVLAGGPPAALRATLHTALDADAGRYPDERAATAAIAAFHGRPTAEVVVGAGAAALLWLLGPALRPRLAVVVHPAFSETEAGLRAHGVPVVRVHRDPTADFVLDPDAVPEVADLVVVGHPVSPSGTLDPSAAILALRRPGRTVVVDEAFMDLVPGEPGSLVGPETPSDVIVVRSLTKSLSIPGLRAGYALAAAPIADALRGVRPPWSVNALALAALTWTAMHPAALIAAAARASREREDLVARLTPLPGLHLWPSATNFVLGRVAHGPAVTAALRAERIAVRPCGSFPGLDDDCLRLTAREPAANSRLADALDRALAGTTASGAPTPTRLPAPEPRRVGV